MTGKNSRFVVGGRLGEMLAAAQSSPDLLDLSARLAEIDVVVSRAAQRLEERDTPDFRARARELLDEVREALPTDPAIAAARLGELAALLERGCEEDRALEMFLGSVERMSKRAEAAWNVALARHNAVSAGHIRLILIRFLESARQEFGDDGARRLSARLEGLLRMPGNVAPGQQGVVDVAVASPAAL